MSTTMSRQMTSMTSTTAAKKGAKSARPAKNLRLRLPLQPIVDEFLEEVEQTLAPATERAYRIPLGLFLRHLRETLGREPTLDDLCIETARGWIGALRQRPKQVRAGTGEGDAPIALASLRNYLRHLRAFANWLAKPPHRYCEESPLRYLKVPRGEETPKVPVAADALQRLLRRAGQEADPVSCARGRALLLALVDGGLRAHELIALTVADVSLKEGVLLVRRAKGRRPRLIALGGETIRALRRYALLRDGQQGETAAPDEPFFRTVSGTAFTYFGLRSWLKRLERDTGVAHVYLHQLRHTSAIETLGAGADLRTVQLKLGHADIRTTQGYLNMSADRAAQLQRAFSPVERLGLATNELEQRREGAKVSKPLPGKTPRTRPTRQQSARKRESAYEASTPGRERSGYAR